MRLAGLCVVVVLVGRPIAAAAQDTVADPARAAQLRQIIEQRFGERLKEELGLTDEQGSKLRISLAGMAARRRGMEQDERKMRQALAAQLRPGVAANADSVARLVDALTAHRVAYAQTFKDEMRDLSTILNPVQRGQYLMLRDRLMQRAEEVLQRRQLQPNLPPGGPFRTPLRQPRRPR
jgi:hypothetical protein